MNFSRYYRNRGKFIYGFDPNIIKIQNNQKIFYIDEDEDVISQKIGANGYPIYRLEEVGESAAVFLPFPQYVSDRIKHKYENKYNHIEFIDFT